MAFKFLWPRGWRRKSPSSRASGDGVALPVANAKGTDSLAKSTQLNEWRPVLTAPIEQLCEAPSADTVRYAYDLYAQQVYAPFAAREARMASRLTDIRACFATLVARAPELVEAALAEHPQVFADIVRLQKRGRP